MEHKPSRLRAALTGGLPFLIGIVAFLLARDPNILRPTNIAWLNHGDLKTHYLGWLFFRHSPWTFPVGLNPAYGLDLSSAILFSDSNPLLSILLKPFSPWLPEPFQFSGAWLLVCFVLQAYFAWKILSLVTTHVPVLAAGAALVALAPPMVARMHGHLSLCGHFLVLAGLYLSLNRDLHNRSRSWAVLLAVASLVHPYLLAMLGVLWLADLVRLWSRRVVRPLVLGVRTAATAVMLGLLCWQVGYFSVGAASGEFGFGFYRTNLLAPFDSAGWSFVLRDLPGFPGEMEGYAYLGLGAILLGVAGFPCVLAGVIRTKALILRYRELVVALVLLAAVAVSNTVAVGGLAFHYPLPDVVVSAMSVFRASGRMFWPVYYVVLLGIIGIVARGHHPRVATWLVGVALVVQVLDTSPGWRGLREEFRKTPARTWDIGLTHPFWDAAATVYSKVRSFPRINAGRQWERMAYYAGTHGLATDAIHLARLGAPTTRHAAPSPSRDEPFALIDRDTLYVFPAKFLFLAMARCDPAADLVARVDDLVVLAPGWLACRRCPPVSGRVEGPPEVTFPGRTLSTAVGAPDAEAMVAREGEHKAGFLTYGPYAPLPMGAYEVSMTYAASAGPETTVGRFDVSDGVSGRRHDAVRLAGTNGVAQTVTVRFVVDAPGRNSYEFRNQWTGLGTMSVHQIRLRRLA